MSDNLQVEGNWQFLDTQTLILDWTKFWGASWVSRHFRLFFSWMSRLFSGKKNSLCAINFLHILTSYIFSIDFRPWSSFKVLCWCVFILYLWTQNVDIAKLTSLEELIKVHNTGKALFGLLWGLIFSFFLCAFTVMFDCAAKTSQ